MNKSLSVRCQVSMILNKYYLFVYQQQQQQQQQQQHDHDHVQIRSFQ